MRYFLNIDAREDGTLVLHAEHCQYVPNPENRTEIGDFDECDGALSLARDDAAPVKPCGVCCTDCDA